MTDGYGNKPRERSDARVPTPRPAPKRYGAADFTEGDLLAWHRFWRELAGDSRRDVCQFCCGVGHQASNCETFTVLIAKGRLFDSAHKAEEEKKEREARVKLIKANSIIAAGKERRDYRDGTLVSMFLGVRLLFHESVWATVPVEAVIGAMLVAAFALGLFLL